jgi:hypothetical protein
MSNIEPSNVINQLESNAAVFGALLANVTDDLAVWKPEPNHWCLLEIVCHLVDEEREDFGARVKSTLEDPNQPLISIDPQGWVQSRNYIEQDFHAKAQEFLDARASSLGWLRALERPSWTNAYSHETRGPLSARFFLENWLAHDYLHTRQINRRKYEYLGRHAIGPLDYAGDW